MDILYLTYTQGFQVSRIGRETHGFWQRPCASRIYIDTSRICPGRQCFT